jgi:hypothetical protein
MTGLSGSAAFQETQEIPVNHTLVASKMDVKRIKEILDNFPDDAVVVYQYQGTVYEVDAIVGANNQVTLFEAKGLRDD